MLKYKQNDTASTEAALKGISRASMVTHVYLRKQKEVYWPKLLMCSTIRLGRKCVVYRSLETVWQLSRGKLQMLHSEWKGQMEDYLWFLGIPSVIICLAVYLESFLTA